MISNEKKAELIKGYQSRINRLGWEMEMMITLRNQLTDELKKDLPSGAFSVVYKAVENIREFGREDGPLAKKDVIQIDHEAYQKKVRTLSKESLYLIIKNGKEAMQANPYGEKAGYYADEVRYAAMELRRREEIQGSEAY